MTGMRLGAAAGAAVLLAVALGAPTIPAMVGAALGYGWLLWRAVAAR